MTAAEKPAKKPGLRATRRAELAAAIADARAVIDKPPPGLGGWGVMRTRRYAEINDELKSAVAETQRIKPIIQPATQRIRAALAALSNLETWSPTIP